MDSGPSTSREGPLVQYDLGGTSDLSLANIQTDMFQVTLWVRELPRGVIVPYYSQLSAGDTNFELLMLSSKSTRHAR